MKSFSLGFGVTVKRYAMNNVAKQSYTTIKYATRYREKHSLVFNVPCHLCQDHGGHQRLHHLPVPGHGGRHRDSSAVRMTNVKCFDLMRFSTGTGPLCSPQSVSVLSTGKIFCPLEIPSSFYISGSLAPSASPGW